MDDWQELLYHRYQIFPKDYRLCFGKYDLSKEEILEHIKKKDKIYELLLKVEKEYFSSLKNRELFGVLAQR